MRFLAAAAILIAGLASGLAQASGEPLKPGASLAFVGIAFVDLSTEGAYRGARADETARIAMLTAHVAAAFEARGFRFVDIPPAVRARIERMANPARCNGCEVTAALGLGADYSLAGEVIKVSNLILSVNLVVRRAGPALAAEPGAPGAIVRALSVDIRGNTDKSWRRGADYILRRAVFAD